MFTYAPKSQRAVSHAVTRVSNSNHKSRPPAGFERLPLRKPPSELATGRQWIQTKLTVSQPGDALEMEADHIADQVMHMPDALVTRATDPDIPEPERAIQRACSGCSNVGVKDDDETNTVQRAVRANTAGSAPSTSGAWLRQLHTLQAGGGEPLPGQVRTLLEPRLGASFANVRLHRGAAAHDLVRGVDARAFTTGGHIFFRNQEFQPRTQQGVRLLAHELAHVLQQGAAKPMVGMRPLAVDSSRGSQQLSTVLRQAASPAKSKGSTVGGFQSALHERDWARAVNILDDQDTTTNAKISKLVTRFKLDNLTSSELDALIGAIGDNPYFNEGTTKLIESARPSVAAREAAVVGVLGTAWEQYPNYETPACTNRGPVVDKFAGEFASAKLPDLQEDKTGRVVNKGGPCGPAWCAHFVRWCLKQNGIPFHGITPRAVSVKNATAYYKTVAERWPAPGDIFYIKPHQREQTSSHPCDSNPCRPKERVDGSGHVGFISSVSEDKVTTIEGNVHATTDNDGVDSRARSLAEIDGALRISKVPTS